MMENEFTWIHSKRKAPTSIPNGVKDLKMIAHGNDGCVYDCGEFVMKVSRLHSNDTSRLDRFLRAFKFAHFGNRYPQYFMTIFAYGVFDDPEFRYGGQVPIEKYMRPDLIEKIKKRNLGEKAIVEILSKHRQQKDH